MPIELKNGKHFYLSLAIPKIFYSGLSQGIKGEL